MPRGHSKRGRAGMLPKSFNLSRPSQRHVPQHNPTGVWLEAVAIYDNNLCLYSICTHLRVQIPESTLHTRQRSFSQSGTEPATPVRPRRLVELAMCVRVCARICLAMHDLCQCQYYTPSLISVVLFPYSRGINCSLLLSTLSILLGVFVLCLFVPSSSRLSF